MNNYASMRHLKCCLVQWAVLCGVMLCTLFLYCQPVGAQSSHASLPIPENLEDLAFEHITAKQGLPQNSVNAIVQDKRGFVWFATQDGLCRYDGYAMKVFRPQAGTPKALQAGFVYRLLVDSRGNLWVPTAGGGLSRYDYEAGKFVTLRFDAKNPKTLPGDDINDICEDASGHLWVAAAQNGIARYNPTTLTVERFALPSFGQQSINEADGGEARSICIDRQGIVWVGVFGRGLYRFDAVQRTWKRFSADASEPEARRLPSNNLWYMMLDSQGTLWVATRNAGVFTLDPVQQRVSARYSHAAENPRSLSHNNAWAVYEDRHNVVWVATFGGGLNRFHRADSSFTALRANPSCPTALASDVVMSMLHDKENNLWIGMQLAGVAKFDNAMQQFTILNSQARCAQATISESVIRSVFEDSRRRLWVGTNKRGVNILVRRSVHPASERFQHIALLLHDSLKSNTIAGNGIWGISEDHDGNIWLATSNGASLLDGVSCKVKKTFRSIPTDKHSLGSNTMRTVFCDSRGRMWMGALSGGLHRYRAERGDFVRYEPESGSSEAGRITSQEVRAICEDIRNNQPTGTLWVGTWGGGLNYFDPEAETFTVFRHSERDSASLASDVVRSLLVDSRGTLWVGTNNGLCRYNREQKNFTIYREPQGLPNNVVYALREDDSGNIWLSTNNGLARLNPSSGRVQAFTVDDGLPENEFNGNVSCKGSDGTLYFGSIGGVVVVQPSRLVQPSPPQAVMFTGFKIFNTPVQLDTAIEECHEVRVRYADNFLTTHFAALAYSGTKSVRYRYRLEGFDKNWVESGEKREAIYTNLDPGSYRLLVQARHNGDTWEHAAQGQIGLVVVPPWWMTWWFRALCAVALVLGGYVGYRTRVKLLERRAQELTRLVKERTAELQDANTEIQRQLEILDEQSREIELTNAELQEKNLALEAAFTQLTEANKEIQRQMAIQDEQATEIELANAELQEKNLALDEALSTLKAAQAQLVQSERMNALGTMTAGVMHEINNPNAAVASAIETAREQIHELREFFLSLLDEESKASPEAQTFEQKVASLGKILGIAYNGAERVKGIVANLQGFTKHQRVGVTKGNLAQEIAATIEIFRYRFKDVAVSTAFAPAMEATVSKANFGELNQVFLNVLVNAAQAGATEIQIQGSLEGCAMVVMVRDNGSGMPAEVQARIFEPFFTTKGVGEGTGLGLSIVRQIIERHEGTIHVESELGVGTLFVISLPLSA